MSQNQSAPRSSDSSDVFPTVSIDRSYGESVNNIDLNLAAITDYLRNQGLSDADIMQFSIHMSGEPSLENHGTYNPVTSAIILYKPDYLHESTFTYRDRAGEDVEYSFNRSAVHVENLTSILVHELEHGVSRRDEEFEEIMDVFINERVEGYRERAREDGLHIRLRSALGGSALLGATLTGLGIVMQNEELAISGPLIGIGLGLAAKHTYNRLLRVRIRELSDIDALDRYKNNPSEIRSRQAALDYNGKTMFIIDSKKVEDPADPFIETLVQALREQPTTALDN